MRNKTTFLLLLNYILSIVILFGQQKETLTIGAQYRPRVIIDNGYKIPKAIDTKPISFISQRTRLNVGYSNPKLETYLSLQDVRYWGDDNNFSATGIYGNNQSTNLYQAWFLYKANKEFSVKIGRQMFKYDDQRILAARNWNDYSITYDAFLFKFDDSINKIDLAVSWNSNNIKNNYLPALKFKIFDFIHYQRQINNINISVLGLITGNTINDTSEAIYLRGTYGLNLNYSKNNFKFRSSNYYQNNLNNNGQKVSAFCISFLAQQKILDKKITLGLGLDYLSGQDATAIDQTINNNFNLLYGVVHNQYGYIDFYGSNPAQGLQDYMLKTEYKVSKKINIYADYHYFKSSNNRFSITNPSELLNKNLGQELDLTFNYNIIDEISLQAGYSFYITTDSYLQIKNLTNIDVKFPQFLYLMITVSPNFTFSNLKQKSI